MRLAWRTLVIHRREGFDRTRKKMATTCDPLILYLHLARAAEMRRRPLARDKLLVMAAAAAMEDGLLPVAALCRAKILEHNPAHLLGKFPSFGHAQGDDRFQALLARVGRDYPRERAEHMLESLGIELGREQAVYQDANEYAAALLGTTPAKLDEWYAQEQGSMGDTDPAETAPATASSDREATTAPGEAPANGHVRLGTKGRRQGLRDWRLLCGLLLLASAIATLLWLVGS